ncbi:MAG: bifunctional 5,10-methylenetetrahydrofolate dehydrogenase/5,10-methenyltetrahydrofolate cyclohydrolase [Pseudomonadota bacterium]
MPPHTSDTTAKMLRGGPIAASIRSELGKPVTILRNQGLVPTLAVVVASDDGAVLAYAEAKQRSGAKLGIALRLERLEAGSGQSDLEDLLDDLSADPSVHGILLELPLADGLNAEAAIAKIDPRKDIDGMTAANLGLIAAGNEDAALAPATPLACIRLAEEATNIAGKRAVVIGRGRTVGRALAPMLVNRNATVTVCHTKTPDLAEAIAPCELVFVAAGKAGLIGPHHLRERQVVVDAGINPAEGGIIGDVSPKAADIVAALTPVPGGVGPLTSTLIFSNLLKAIGLQGKGDTSP